MFNNTCIGFSDLFLQISGQCEECVLLWNWKLLFEKSFHFNLCASSCSFASSDQKRFNLAIHFQQHPNLQQCFTEISGYTYPAKLNADITWLKRTPYKFIHICASKWNNGFNWRGKVAVCESMKVKQAAFCRKWAGKCTHASVFDEAFYFTWGTIIWNVHTCTCSCINSTLNVHL